MDLKYLKTPLSEIHAKIAAMEDKLADAEHTALELRDTIAKLQAECAETHITDTEAIDAAKEQIESLFVEMRDVVRRWKYCREAIPASELYELIANWVREEITDFP